MEKETFAAACARCSMGEDFFRLFGELARVPHGSGDVKRISDWLCAFAEEHGLRHVQDEKYNVIIYKEGTPGRENHPPVILQGHMDMVCDHLPEAPDPATEGVFPVTDGEWVWAEGTTLGADNGIAVAYTLAILISDTIPHPPLEAVFTVDEEVGMEGAAWLKPELLQGRTLLNLDSEDEGILTVGCAGGTRLEIGVPAQREPAQGTLCEIAVSGMEGGHSGILIAEGRANAIKVLGRILAAVERETPLRLVELEGGQKDNAIPYSARARVVLDPASLERAREVTDAVVKEEQKSYAATDPGLQGGLTVLEGEGKAMTEDLSRRLIRFLEKVPDGVLIYVKKMPGLPETSLNLGVLRTEGETVQMVISTRSSVRGVCGRLVEELKMLAAPLQADCKIRGPYPPWEYRSQSRLQEICKEAYREQYGEEMKVEIIHAGLECGLFSDKMPDLDAVSFGPDLRDVHSVRERMDVASARRTWELLLRILERL